MAGPKLTLEARRIRMIIVSTPIMVASAYVLYKRLYLGEEQRKFPRQPGEQSVGVRLIDKDTKELN